MIAKIDCIPCILDDVRGAVELLTDDESIKRQIMKESLELLAQNIDLKKEPSFYITEVHRIVKRICNIEVPFAQRRYACNELGMKLAENLKKSIDQLDGFERFSLLVRWSIASNALDFRTVGTGYDFDIHEVEKSLSDLASQLDVDQLPQIYEKVRSAQRILFVHDNVGEIALDKLLIEDIRANCKAQDKKMVVSAVRGGPITSDATMDDAQQVGLHETATSIILAGSDTLGISFEEMSREFKEELDQADLVIAKGQANYYVFSEHRDEISCPVVSLFRTKCHIVYDVFHAEDNISLAAIL